MNLTKRFQYGGIISLDKDRRKSDMEERLRQADIERLKFIEDCLTYDTPRLRSEKYPEDVEVTSDISYSEGLTMDLYTPRNAKDDEVFLLTHGGAFVYGSKALDKCFGMHLAIRSGITVANIDYTLMPDTDLKGQLRQIFSAVEFLAGNGKKVFHTVGDSAGGYLAFITAMLINSERAREACGIPLNADVRAAGANLICTMYKTPADTFPGIYFEKEDKLPSFIYDLSEAVRTYGAPDTVIATGDLDFLREDDKELASFLEGEGIRVKFYDAISEGERKMYHVYPISCPTWPEGSHVIDLMSGNANGR